LALTEAGRLGQGATRYDAAIMFFAAARG
jgi:hypothetical protein